MAKNLWGDLSSLATVRTPKTLLEEQANVLTEATAGLLMGRVYDLAPLGRDPRVSLSDDRAKFRYDFDVLVPALNNYRYTILSVYYPLELYPLDAENLQPTSRGNIEKRGRVRSGRARGPAFRRGKISAFPFEIPGNDVLRF